MKLARGTVCPVRHRPRRQSILATDECRHGAPEPDEVEANSSDARWTVRAVELVRGPLMPTGDGETRQSRSGLVTLTIPIGQGRREVRPTCGVLGEPEAVLDVDPGSVGPILRHANSTPWTIQRTHH